MNNNFDMIPLYGKITCKDSGGGGGVTPSGTKEITIKENGNFLHDVAGYAAASIDVDVPVPEGYIIPSGTKEITIRENGNFSHDVSWYAATSIDVDVPVPEGYIIPSGTKEITIKENGSVIEDVSGYASASIDVDVPIPEGYIIPSGTKEIILTENGSVIEDVNAYESVDISVNIPDTSSELLDELLYPTGSKSIDIDSTVDVVTAYAMRGQTSVKSVKLRNATDINVSAFDGCSNLSSLYAPEATRIYNNAFLNCAALSEIYLPKVRTIDNSSSGGVTGAFYACAFSEANLPSVESIGNRAFYLCKNLTTLYAPNCTSIGNGALALCPSLKKVTLGATKMNVDAFWSGPGSSYYGVGTTTCEILDIVGDTATGINIGYIPEGIQELIIRNTSGIVPEIDSNDYTSKFTKLKIFVPNTLLSAYRNATNWTLYANKFYALEDYDVITG